MQRLSSSAIACRHCRYFVPEGRRGGSCQLLDAFVQGKWQACSLSIPFFGLVQSKQDSNSKRDEIQIAHPIEVMPSQQLVTQYLAGQYPFTSNDLVPSQKNLR